MFTAGILFTYTYYLFAMNLKFTLSVNLKTARTWNKLLLSYIDKMCEEVKMQIRTLNWAKNLLVLIRSLIFSIFLMINALYILQGIFYLIHLI